MWGLHNHYTNPNPVPTTSGHFNASTLDLTVPIITSKRSDGRPFHPRKKHPIQPNFASSASFVYSDADVQHRPAALRVNTDVTEYGIHSIRTCPEFSLNTSHLSFRPLERAASPPPPPPPRNPRRCYPRNWSWRPPSSIYEKNTDLDSESVSSIDMSEVATPTQMADRLASVEISPPSSPDVAGQVAHSEDISPIDGDFDDVGPQKAQTARIVPVRPQSRLDEQRREPQHQMSSSKIQGPSGRISADQKGRSAIPTLRNDRRQQQERPFHAAESRRPANIPPRRESLQPQHLYPYHEAWASPENPSHHSRHQTRPSSGSTTMIKGPQTPRASGRDSPSRGERLKHFGRDSGRPRPLEDRPPWNGASGRQALVRPVHDDFTVRPLNITNKNRGASPTISSISQNHRPSHLLSGGSNATPVVQSVPHRQQNQRTEYPGPISLPAPIKFASSESNSKPDTNYAEYGAPRAFSPDSRSVTPTGILNSPEPVAAALKLIKRKPAPTPCVQAMEPSPEPPRYPAKVGGDTDTMGSDLKLAPTSMDHVGAADGLADAWVAPPSRFSVTTYATSIAESPRPSLDEERPPLPTATEQSPSVMNRTRPLRESDGHSSGPSEPIVISMDSPYSTRSRKPQNKTKKSGENNLEFHIRTISAVETSVDRRASIPALGKALPPAPPEILSANDRVANLDARLNGLALRRDNINKSIKQMTDLMPHHHLMADAEVLQRRADEKDKVERLREELANVQQEEYELGIKLHRAHKRLARESDFEPANLWVRRVTS